MAASSGWKSLVDGYPWFRGAGSFPLPAYSEYMPPPRLGRRPYGEGDPALFEEDDPFGWRISEIEQEYEIGSGLQNIARQMMEQFVHLGRGEPAYKIGGIRGRNLSENPYWPANLAAAAGHLAHERYVLLSPLALSRTQDDMGRIRWTFFGGSEQGPERAFWASFYSAPERELPFAVFDAFMRRLLQGAFGAKPIDSTSLHEFGLRILPSEANESFPYWVSAVPSWTHELILGRDADLKTVRYLLTFQPFARLPSAVQEAYLGGRLALIPFPGSLVPWGVLPYQELAKQLPFAVQMPLQRLVQRHGGPSGIRVPQSGWLHVPRGTETRAEIQDDLLVNTYPRTSRWDRVERDSDDQDKTARTDRVARVLFSTALDAIGLYDKPEARNAQVWTEKNQVLLDGPNAGRDQIRRAAEAVLEGGLARYRFQFPPMQVGPYAVYWHRPLAAFLKHGTNELEVMDDVLHGFLTAYRADAPDLANPILLWPRLLRREPYLAAILQADEAHEHFKHQTALNVISLLDNRQLYGQPLPRPFARQMLRLREKISLEEWLDRLPNVMNDTAAAATVKSELSRALTQPGEAAAPTEPITLGETAGRPFEVAYWQDIVTLSEGRYLTKDNADVVDDPVTLSEVKHHQRDLEQLGDYLLQRHRRAIAESGLEGKAVAGEVAFEWQTDLEYADFGGWKADQDGTAYERDLLVVIPGKNRGEAVVMADHYDTAYEEDVFDKSKGGSGARLAAPGADDNASATATLLRAAPIFLELAKQGRLERDVWLLHLTGEEFPADCLGARHFTQALVEGTLKLKTQEQELDLAGTRVVGVYVMDMIAHNRDSEPDIFQISPGRGPGALWLARRAQVANSLWNEKAALWNKEPERAGKGRGVRSKNAAEIPGVAAYPELDGQVRTTDDPQSSLYNTDGQIFSDAGIPVVLFMENYDINRTGYHDTHDTMENIDLDYGAALSRICIETVARVAVEGGPDSTAG